ISKVVRLLYCWAAQRLVTKAAQEVAVSVTTVTKLYRECRDICSDELVKCNAMVGGEGCIVEIDETSLKKKSKYNPGRHYDDCWLFGGVERNTFYYHQAAYQAGDFNHLGQILFIRVRKRETHSREQQTFGRYELFASMGQPFEEFCQSLEWCPHTNY
ncbi:hypothetical protein AeRB84_019727, partial [Aphanomyces euteiches]